MKKLTLSVGLVAAMLSAKSQDTTRVMITDKRVYYFNKNESTAYNYYLHKNNIFFNIGNNEVLRVHLYDEVNKTRTFITEYYDNRPLTKNVLNSTDNIYNSPIGPFRVEIK
tara:strand:+ start:507 stop:839 length:333 start_codon:yes stop_codon:yes gene_type:complete